MRVLLIQNGPVPTEVQIFPDLATLNRAAADEVERVIREAVRRTGSCRLALSGGSTPRSVHGLLAADTMADPVRVPWDGVQIFFGDERVVPADHPESNYRMARETLLSKVPVKASNVHRVETDQEPATAAKLYEEEIRKVFGIGPGAWPRFDLILLGMGPDGHTASLFPGTPGLQEKQSLVCANWVERFHSYRITMTFPVLAAAAEILFLVAGAEKAPTLGRVLGAGDREVLYPVQMVRPGAGRVRWMIDEAAAQEVPPAVSAA